MWWNDYLSVPFAEKGRDRSGADCWGLVRLIYREVYGVDLPDYRELYENTKDAERIKALVDDKASQHWQDVDKPQEGDIVFVKMDGIPTHVAIVTKPGYMLHCLKGMGTVHEAYNTMKWRNKIAGFARWNKF